MHIMLIRQGPLQKTKQYKYKYTFFLSSIFEDKDIFNLFIEFLFITRTF